MQGLSITRFIDILQQDLPPALAMPDDPVGIQVLPEDVELRGIAVAYEVTGNVIERTVEADANLLIVFHPLIYPSLQRITPETRVERCVIELIQRKIALYVVHTAFDAHPRGTSMLLARKLGIEHPGPLVPNPVMTNAGMGAVGELPEGVTLETLAARLRTACSSECVRISATGNAALARVVRRVAIVGGSGMSFYEDAVTAGADAFITADVRYHSFHAASDRVPVLDPGHAESEALVAEGLADIVRPVAGRIASPVPVTVIAIPTNPVQYLTGN